MLKAGSYIYIYIMKTKQCLYTYMIYSQSYFLQVGHSADPLQVTLVESHSVVEANEPHHHCINECVSNIHTHSKA